jgi:transposase
VGRRGQSPVQVMLTASERKLLKRWVRTPTAPYRQVLRAKVVLLAAAGHRNAHIAERLQVTGNTVRKWRRRFRQQGLVGLRDRPRSGRPRRFPAVVVAQAKAIACELPATRGTPTSRWSLADLRDELLVTGLVEEISTTTLWRWLAEDAIRPWQHRSWVFPRAPDFAARAGVALDLYQRRF